MAVSYHHVIAAIRQLVEPCLNQPDSFDVLPDGEAHSHTGAKRKAGVYKKLCVKTSPGMAEIIAPGADLHDLFSQVPPAGRPHISAGEGARRESHDLIDLAPRDLDFYGGVQEIRRIYGELQRFAGRKDWPHA